MEEIKMAGITLICSADKFWVERHLPHAKGWCSSLPEYECRTVFRNPWGELTLTAYQGYPFEIFETADTQIAFEGKIYNRSRVTLERELVEISDTLFRKGPESYRKLAHWISEVDGEFLVIVHTKKTQEIAVFSDYLGRLPVYWAWAGEVLVLSRHMEVFVNFLPQSSPDPMGVAQSLIFLYPLGTRTLLRNIKLFRPGTLMLFRPRIGVLKLEELHAFNLEEKSEEPCGVGDAAAEIATLIKEASLRRAENNEVNIISLSGGLDSRAVGAALAGGRARVIAATHLDHSKSMLRDVDVAKSLARVFRIPWNVYELQPVTGAEALELLYLKGGANSLHMAMLLPFLRTLKSKYGQKITLFTGDGGDKVIPDLRPPLYLRNLRALALYVIHENHVFSLEEITQITNVQTEEIVAELESILGDYPEQDLRQKYVHFLLFERGRRWLYEGEDRNRAILWPTTPFYAPNVFRRCMATSDDLKKNYNLYRHVLSQLTPATSHVPNAAWGMPINSIHAKVNLYLKSVYRRVPYALRSFIRRHKNSNRNQISLPLQNAGECLRQMIASVQGTDVFQENLPVDSLLNKKNERSFKILFTMAAFCELVNRRDSSLEKHLDEKLF